MLIDTFAKAGLQAQVEVYDGAALGWCSPDSQVYNVPQVERAWSRLLTLYETSVGLSYRQYAGRPLTKG